MIWCGYCVDYTKGPCMEDHSGDEEFFVPEPDDEYEEDNGIQGQTQYCVTVKDSRKNVDDGM